ncbi:MAG: tetratricopeptide repeat protein [Planctomycetes bacterium]|nr:tetratricopeptide repeat protein [Planctomycetota bacterium]
MTVFISYSHDSSEHSERVLALSNRLREEGVDCQIDQYETSPPEGWPRWMNGQFRGASYVLVVCTETYYRRAAGTESPGVGRGARWESSQVFQELYDADSMNTKFIPVIFSADDQRFIPEPLRGFTHYDLSTDRGYEDLYRHLTEQPNIVTPALGQVRVLSPRRPADPSEPAKGFWNVPLRRNEFFSGRHDLLITLHGRLKPAGDRHSPFVIGLTGLGGVGKTQVSAELAYRFRNDYSAVIWVRADSEASIYQSVLDAKVGLGLHDAATDDPKTVVAAFLRWLKDNSGWLLIFDSADHLDLLPPYLPVTGAGAVLVTSRARNLDPVGTRCVIDLTELLPDESVSFLLNRTRRSDASDDELAAANEICSELGHLPLALEQAGAYIAAKASLFQAYLSSYRTRRLELLEQMKPSMGSYPASVTTTWAINFDEITRESSASADLLRATAFLSPAAIPLEFVVGGAEELSNAISTTLAGFLDNPVALDELVEPVARYSLVRRDIDDQTLSTHRLVQEVLRDGMTPGERRSWMERIVRAVDKCFLVPTEFEHWQSCERLVPHALVAVQHCEDEQLQTRSPGHLLNRLGCYLLDHARYSEGHALLERALEVRRKSLGATHPYVAETLSNLGLVAERQGAHSRAEGLHREALSIVQGSGNEQEAAAENNLASALLELGKFTEAEQAFRRSIELKSVARERGDPRIAVTMVNLASLRATLGDLAEASELLRGVIELEDQLLPSNHPVRATAMENLATVKRTLGETREAERLRIECLKIKVAAYGPYHPEVGGTLSNLAVLFADEERFDEAEDACKHAIAIFEDALGPRHPLLAGAINNLGAIYLQQSHYSDAEEQLCRSIDIWEAAEDPGSWRLAATLGNCATLYEETDRHTEAETFAMRALLVAERCFGPCHPNVVREMLRVGRLLMCTGKLSQAREYAHRAMSACEPSERANLDDFLESTRLLATIEEESGHVGEATALYRQYIDLADAQLAPGRELAMALYNFGAHMAEHGHRDEGVASLLRAADVAASSLVAESFEEGLALYGAANVFGKAGEPTKAEAYGRRALAILRKHEARHPHDGVCCVSLLATVCHSQEKLVEAESFYRETIEAWESLGKPKLKDIVVTLHGYGLLESEGGRLVHARELLDMATEMADKVLGPADLERAALYNSQAVYYEAAGEGEKAMQMCQKALGVWEAAGWPNHPHVLIAFRNYVDFLNAHKRFIELESVLPRAIEECQKIVGRNSRDEAILRNELGVAVGEQGRPDEAIGFFKSALAIWEVIDWPEDDGVNVVHTNLYSCALMHSDFSTAVSTAESALAYARRHYGARHPALVGRLNNLGVAYREGRKFDLAKDYFEQALRMVNCTMGSDHVELPTVLSNYARLRRAQGREQAAKKLEDKANRAARRLRRKRKRRR